MPPIQPLERPFEAMSPVTFDNGDDLPCLLGTERAIRLVRRGNLLWPRAQQLLLVERANQFDGRLIAIDQFDCPRVVQPDGVRTPLEQVLKHLTTVPER